MYGVQPPLTDAVIQDAECRLGVRLPASLLDILRVQNGGLVAESWNAFPTDVPTSWSEDHVPLDEIRGIGRQDGQPSLLDSDYLVEEWGLPSPLVLLSGDGHCWIALDYRTCGRLGEPSVTWFHVDDDTELPLTRAPRQPMAPSAPSNGCGGQVRSWNHEPSRRGAPAHLDAALHGSPGSRRPRSACLAGRA
ncbi:SMI1/KNR4 family protein [Streptomyces sp. NBC_01257]|uniref:SMI1/KNR4 family protein n=1 Tax=Streptomyces sp. NBC_01257 TaxID=2903799 RepID=UPI003FA3BE15